MKNNRKSELAKLYQGDGQVYSNNDVIVRAGKMQKTSYYIRSGIVKLCDVDAGGNVKTIVLLGPGDMFPLVWAFDDSLEPVYSYKALGSVEVASVDIKLLKSALSTNIDASGESHSAFVRLTWDLMERVKSLQMPYTQEKIIRLLPYLAAKMGYKKEGSIFEITHTITQGEIALLLGATRESVSAHLAKLESKKIIDRSTRYLRIDMDRIPEEFIHKIWFKTKS